MSHNNLSIINKRVPKKEIPLLEKEGYTTNLTYNILTVKKNKLNNIK